MTFRSFFLLLAALSLPGAPLQAQQAKAGDKTEIHNSTAAQSAGTPLVHARPAIWRVKDRDTTIYLFGTIHLMKPNIVWFEGPVRKAYDKAQEVVVEVAETPGPALQARIMQKAMAPDGPTVTEQLPEDVRPQYAKMLEQLGPGAAMLDKVQPWFAALALTTEPLRKLGYDAANGVDRTVMAQAGKDKKLLTGLETAEGQIDLFAQLPKDLQILLLSETLREQDKIGETIGKMIKAWVEGDPVALAQDMNESMEESPELMKRLLFDRNEAWADWIKARMAKPGTVFIAVGAGHLAGPGSVQDALGRRGIKSSLIKP